MWGLRNKLVESIVISKIMLIPEETNSMKNDFKDHSKLSKQVIEDKPIPETEH